MRARFPLTHARVMRISREIGSSRDSFSCWFSYQALLAKRQHIKDFSERDDTPRQRAMFMDRSSQERRERNELWE
jgi:hypothetical protein